MHNGAIGVILDADRAARNRDDLPPYAAPYVTEILGHAGIAFDLMARDTLAADLSGYAVLILAQDLALTSEQTAGADMFVQRGGVVIGLGGTSGMDALFGVETTGDLSAGYLQPPRTLHPVTEGLRRAVRVFGGCRIRAASGASLASLEADDGFALDAIVEHESGQGWAILVAPDLATSVVHIQQGMPVEPEAPREWASSPNGSVLGRDEDLDTVEIASFDDLYYSHTVREPRGTDGLPVYRQRLLLEPMADALRELLVRAIFYALSRCGSTTSVLWYWPRGLTSIGHISHDSDGQRQSQAWTLFHLLNELDVLTTWCIMPVPGYSRQFFNALKQERYEIGLHYATGNSPIRTDRRWSQTDFEWQVDALRYLAQIDAVVTNKNHGLAMQGRLEFYRWCESKGLQTDQTRGDKGFTFGTCHPSFPIEDGLAGGPTIDVLTLPLLTQDLSVVCPIGFMKPMVDRCNAAYGVAHFLFHPSHAEDPQHQRAVRETVGYARSLGMEWWRSDEINAWERARRTVSVAALGDGLSAESAYLVEAGDRLQEATLLFLLPDGTSETSVSLGGEALQAPVVRRYGFRFAQVTCDLFGEHLFSIAERENR